MSKKGLGKLMALTAVAGAAAAGISYLKKYHSFNKELDKDFQDETHIIYVNSKKQDDTELGKLMHDLHCKNAEEMHSGILAERVRELKETERGVEIMCREMEQIYSEGMESGRQEGREEGRKQGQIETLAGLVMDGKLDIKTAAASSGMTEQEFQAEMEKLKR